MENCILTYYVTTNEKKKKNVHLALGIYLRKILAAFIVTASKNSIHLNQNVRNEP